MMCSMLFGFLYFLPVGPNLVHILNFDVSKHVRMPTDQLGCDMPRHAIEIEGPAFSGELTMKYHLEQQISQFLLELVVVVGFDRVEEFVNFLHRMPAQRSVVLLPIPGAACGRTQPGHYVYQIV